MYVFQYSPVSRVIFLSCCQLLCFLLQFTRFCWHANITKLYQSWCTRCDMHLTQGKVCSIFKKIVLKLSLILIQSFIHANYYVLPKSLCYFIVFVISSNRIFVSLLALSAYPFHQIVGNNAQCITALNSFCLGNL